MRDQSARATRGASASVGTVEAQCTSRAERADTAKNAAEGQALCAADLDSCPMFTRPAEDHVSADKLARGSANRDRADGARETAMTYGQRTSENERTRGFARGVPSEQNCRRARPEIRAPKRAVLERA